MRDRLACGEGFELAGLWKTGGAILAFGQARLIRSIDPMPHRPDRLVVHLSGGVEIVCARSAARRYVSPERVAEMVAATDAEAVAP